MTVILKVPYGMLGSAHPGDVLHGRCALYAAAFDSSDAAAAMIARLASN